MPQFQYNQTSPAATMSEMNKIKGNQTPGMTDSGSDKDELYKKALNDLSGPTVQNVKAQDPLEGLFPVTNQYVRGY